ncbi:hypothetical protein F4859DRAFT_484918 [Xylaria cf. heliscus]|nr:hypothetical protein F4859DRAFT_484918 [Xylaria cf. heliscus]
MRVSACLQAALALTISTSPAIALVIGEDETHVNAGLMLRDLGCNRDAINTCVTSTRQDSSTCFGALCAGRAIEKAVKREDQCTEENLLQCAILDWNEAQACFQSLCPLAQLTITRSKDVFNEASCRPTTMERTFGYGAIQVERADHDMASKAQ